MLNTININLKTDIKTDKPTILPIKLMSQDKNNNRFILRFTNGGEMVALDDTYTVEVLTKFAKSGTSRLTTAKVRRDYATWEFDTAYITQDEAVYNYVYVRKSGLLVVSADSNAFHFDVGLSEIDKTAGRVAETYDENYEKVLSDYSGTLDDRTNERLDEAVSDFNQRGDDEIDDWREYADAELEDYLAGKVVIKNLVKNGDFSDGLTNWSVGIQFSNDTKVVDGKLRVHLQNSGAMMYPTIRQPTYSTVGHKNYFRIEVSEMASDSIPFSLQDRNQRLITPSSDGVYSIVRTIDSGQTLTNLYLNHAVATGNLVDYKVDNIISIDLTETFGAGNEPSKEEMDELIKVTGYIDGEYALNNKEMLTWSLSLIRRNH